VPVILDQILMKVELSGQFFAKLCLQVLTMDMIADCPPVFSKSYVGVVHAYLSLAIFVLSLVIDVIFGIIIFIQGIYAYIPEKNPCP
jgi:hypothetical protein